MRFMKIVGMCLAFSLGSLISGPLFAQGVPKHYLSAASTNATNVFASKGFIRGGVVGNTNATVYYLKLYDKATAPTCGTDVPVWTVPLIASANTPIPSVQGGLQFNLGIGFCITAALADTDTGNAATGIVVDLSVSGR
jgi:hypothetical protein